MRISRVNNGLLVLIISINAYIIAAPLLPNLSFWWKDRSSGGVTRQLNAELHSKTGQDHAPAPSAADNRLIIPSMLLSQPVLEGSIANQYKTLDKGIWRWPNGSTPDKGSNTVLIGHRFTYTQPQGVFYFLNKVKLGDEIGLVWHSQTYTYKVNNVRVVPPTDISIEQATADSRLTIFTCTPLWWPKDRLVVTAELERV